MSAAVTYSYKPASGLEGASTIVPLKKGGFLEVRRGSKTRWTDGEARQTWQTLDAWKAELPADAVVVEKLRSSGRSNPCCWSDDFKAARDLVKRMTGMYPSKYTVYSQDRDAFISRIESYILSLPGLIKLCSPDTMMYNFYKQKMRHSAAVLKDLKTLAVDPFFCEKYFQKHLIPLYAQRISDNSFVPIFFDTEKGLLHTPAYAALHYDKIARVGRTFAELGLRPVFLVHARYREDIQLVSLLPEAAGATGGGSAAAST